MSINKSDFIIFRIKPEQKEMLLNIAQREEVRLSELIRRLVFKKLKKERLPN